MPSSSFSMRIDDELKSAIEEEARREDLSAAQVVTRAVRWHLKGQEAERRAIEAAVDEADKGKFISEEAFNAWIDSWDTDNELPMPKAE